MSKAKKQTGIGGSIFGLVLFLIVGIALIASEADNLFGETRNINDVIASGGPEKGEYVSIGVGAVVDWYAETEYKVNGIIPAGSKQHCLVWLDDGSFISLTVKGKNKDKIDDIIDATWDYLDYTTDYIDCTPVVLEGQITNIGSEVSQYYYDALDAYGISETDGYEVYYLTIDTTLSKTKTWIYFGFCMLMVVIFLVVLIINIKAKKKADATPAAAVGGTQDNLYGGSYDPTAPDNFSNQAYNGDVNNANTYSDNNNNLYQ